MGHSSSALLDAPALDERLAAIRRSMPDLEATIDVLLRSGKDLDRLKGLEDFLEACDDYETCQRALADPVFEDFVPQYQLFSKTIEHQIRRFLWRHTRS